MITFTYHVSQHLLNGKWEKIAICISEDCAKEKIPAEYIRETYYHDYTTPEVGIRRTVYHRELPLIDDMSEGDDVLSFLNQDSWDFYEITKRPIFL